MNITPEQYDEIWPERIRTALTSIKTSLDKEQQAVRDVHLMEWKKNDYWWRNIQNIYWSEVARDWRPYEEGIRDNENLGLDSDSLGVVANIYRGYGQSIIAGLSTSLPSVRFSPDDAENPDDVSTAKAFSKISDLIDLHNDISLKFIKALFILWNQPFVAAYNYHNTDPEYGLHKIPSVDYVDQEQTVETCPECAEELNPDSGMEMKFCENCGLDVIPEVQSELIQLPVPTEINSPKGREIIEIYGAMNVKLPFWISELSNTPYLALQTDHHYAMLRSKFPWIAEKIQPSRSKDSMEKWARQPSDYYSDSDSEINCLNRWWFRPWTYHILPDKEIVHELLEKYPNGVYVAFVEDIFAECFDERLDEHWTVSESPTSNHVHDIPMGKTIEDVQEMTNDVVNLIIRTIKFGVPITFADSNAIDWDKFPQNRLEPGMIIPTRPSSTGIGLSGRFHTIKTATLSQEVDEFWGRLEQLGQFLSGAFPSIYGGSMQGGSKTYKEYESSRAQALQRLSLTWKMLNVWFKNLKTKACKEFARNIQYDEKFAKRQGDSFVNVWIRKSELSGEIGNVEAETSDQFPQSIQQKRGLILELMQNPAPQMQAILADPENSGLIKNILGLNEIYIPGSDQRDKQLREIFEMMKSDPSQMVGPDGMMPDPVPIPVDPYDDDVIHIQTLTAFLIGDVGNELKMMNPFAYQAIMMHYQMHQMQMEQKMQAQMEAQAAQQQMMNPEQDQGEGKEIVQ